MQTRSYQSLCDQLPGKRFLHHESGSLASYIEKKGCTLAVAEMLEWIPFCIKKFGPFTQERASYWTICLFLQKELGMSLEAINKIGERELEKNAA